MVLETTLAYGEDQVNSLLLISAIPFGMEQEEYLDAMLNGDLEPEGYNPKHPNPLRHAQLVLGEALYNALQNWGMYGWDPDTHTAICLLLTPQSPQALAQVIQREAWCVAENNNAAETPRLWIRSATTGGAEALRLIFKDLLPQLKAAIQQKEGDETLDDLLAEFSRAFLRETERWAPSEHITNEEDIAVLDAAETRDMEKYAPSADAAAEEALRNMDAEKLRTLLREIDGHTAIYGEETFHSWGAPQAVIDFHSRRIWSSISWGETLFDAEGYPIAYIDGIHGGAFLAWACAILNPTYKVSAYGRGSRAREHIAAILEVLPKPQTKKETEA